MNRYAAAVLGVALAASASEGNPRRAAPAAADQDRPATGEPKPAPSGLTESVGISLIGLDAVVTDKGGRPVRGLTAADFRLLLDQKEWPLYAVDDSCACDDAAQVAADRAAGGGQVRSTGGDVASGAGATPLIPRDRVVLYFDFSQLQAPGRTDAFKQARRWLREIKQPDDLVLLAAYASAPGLREVTGFTAERGTLLRALEALEGDRAFQDLFPLKLNSRIKDCLSCSGECYPEPLGGCPGCCNSFAFEEYQQGQRSLEAMQALMARMGEYPGPKEFLLFTQNGVLEPSRFYAGRDRRSVLPGLRQEAEDLSAAALTSRVSISVASGTDLLMNTLTDLGDRLAELTGGRSNRNWADYSAVVGEIGKVCCRYRLSFRPPDPERRALYQAVVFARGRRLPATYRVEFLPEAARWFRRATAVLATPDLPRELNLAGALVPLALERGRWEIAVRLSLDTDELAVLPVGDGFQNRWEVAALVSAEKGRTTELGTVVQIRRGRSGPVAVMQGSAGDLRSGRCRLRALVGDREDNRFGGVEAGIDLPAAAEARALGPYLLYAAPTPLSVSLPGLLETGPEPSPAAPAGRLPPTAAPLLDPLPAGRTLIAVSLLCGEAARTWEADGTPPTIVPAAPARRFISQGGQPLSGVEAGAAEPAGECLRFIDRVDTSALTPGAYRFHFRWGATGAEEMSAGFSLVASP